MLRVAKIVSLVALSAICAGLGAFLFVIQSGLRLAYGACRREPSERCASAAIGILAASPGPRMEAHALDLLKARCLVAETEACLALAGSESAVPAPPGLAREVGLPNGGELLASAATEAGFLLLLRVAGGRDELFEIAADATARGRGTLPLLPSGADSHLLLGDRAIGFAHVEQVTRIYERLPGGAAARLVFDGNANRTYGGRVTAVVGFASASSVAGKGRPPPDARDYREGRKANPYLPVAYGAAACERPRPRLDPGSVYLVGARLGPEQEPSVVDLLHPGWPALGQVDPVRAKGMRITPDGELIYLLIAGPSRFVPDAHWRDESRCRALASEDPLVPNPCPAQESPVFAASSEDGALSAACYSSFVHRGRRYEFGISAPWTLLGVGAGGLALIQRSANYRVMSPERPSLALFGLEGDPLAVDGLPQAEVLASRVPGEGFDVVLEERDSGALSLWHLTARAAASRVGSYPRPALPVQPRGEGFLDGALGPRRAFFALGRWGRDAMAVYRAEVDGAEARPVYFFAETSGAFGLAIGP